jgi:ribosomal protein S12 methylthiotransferase
MKVGFVSLGCPKNLVDSEVMIGLSQQAGYEVTADPAEAEVLIVNTCAFIDSARRESVDAILEMAEFKKTGACRRLVVTGCLGERYRAELSAEIPEVDAVLGTDDVPGIVRAIDGIAPAEATAPPGGLLPAGRGLPTYLYDAETPRTLSTPRHYAYLKVAEGCNHRCTFCIIPRVRGAYRSRPAGSILVEARRLAERGVREIILVSQDTAAYGRDRGERGALARLLRDLNRVDGLGWIRLMYLHPTTVTDDLLAAIAESEKVCKYVDLPLQHAAGTVLRRMGRPGTRRTYSRLLARIRARVPGVAVRTTVIVGFPGETGAEFDELVSFVREQAFEHLGAFPYSHEEGTRAWARADDVPARVKRARRHRLLAVQQRLVARAQRALVGRQVRVLVDGPVPEHELVLGGRLEGQAPDIDSRVYLTDADPGCHRAGTFVDAAVVGARGYDLLARPLLPATRCDKILDSE